MSHVGPPFRQINNLEEITRLRVAGLVNCAHTTLRSRGAWQAGPLLFGRRTYLDFFAVWPGRKDNPFTAVLDNSQKYVASRTLREPLPWQNSTLLSGDAAETVARLKEQPGKDMVVMGSGELLQTLRLLGLPPAPPR